LRLRHPDRLVIVLGDQLDDGLFERLDPERDVMWMAEVADEATSVWSHQARIALFLSAMRHFRQKAETRGITVRYLELGAHEHPGLAEALTADLRELRPMRVLMRRPGEYRVGTLVEAACRRCRTDLEVEEDPHFLCTPAEFADWSRERKQTRLEHFYRHMRQRYGVMMDGRQPAGGQWNFDARNRSSFGRQGPGMVPPVRGFEPDRTTREVLSLVRDRFASHPGSLVNFDWPVSRQDALTALTDFVEGRLPAFGQWQDAMWTGQPFLYHARLSAALNLKLLNPREVIDAVEHAWQLGRAPIEAAEGLIRQVLGWREFVRGVYWREMPGYAAHNSLQASVSLPAFYWTADTDMACLHAVIGQTLRYGYAHHIQRLMVTGLFALLLGVEPRQIHEWYLAMYVDAVEWVELPNTIGMSQFADGGIVASKPYVASGNYIQRMSDYCGRCRYNPKQATGRGACPFTTLYWAFLLRHRERFERHPRAGMQWRHLWRLGDGERQEIRVSAERLRARLGAHRHTT
jgi:deoxyribodipyrimidine photolyase-related protein